MMRDQFVVVDSATLKESENRLEQGDIFFKIPRYSVETVYWREREWEKAPPEVTPEWVDGIVLSQTCDLVQGKLEEVLFAEVIGWEEYRKFELTPSKTADGRDRKPRTNVDSREYLEAIRSGHVPGISLLGKFPEDTGVQLPWSVVSFKRLFIHPFRLVSMIADQTGPRLRLQPPYREHLSQAFARYFMRVGLPHNEEFVRECARSPRPPTSS